MGEEEISEHLCQESEAILQLRITTKPSYANPPTAIAAPDWDTYQLKWGSVKALSIKHKAPEFTGILLVLRGLAARQQLEALIGS